MVSVFNIPEFLHPLLLMTAIGVFAMWVTGAFTPRGTIQMDLNSGRCRAVQEFWGVTLRTLPVEPLWIAEFAGSSDPNWVPVRQDSKQSRIRVCYSWSGMYFFVGAMEEYFQTWEIPPEVRVAIAQETLALMQSDMHPRMMQDILDQACREIIIESSERHELASPDVVDACFERLKALARAADADQAD